MPARSDYLGGAGSWPTKDVPRPAPMDPPPSPPGHWHDGFFEFAPGHSLADGQFVCPYGDHIVEMDGEEWDDEDDWGEGYCEVCERHVEIDYQPASVILEVA